MKKKFLLRFLGLFLFLAITGNAWSQEILPTDYDSDISIMRPDRETLLKWIEDYEKAPRAFIDEKIKAELFQAQAESVGTSMSLLNYIQYIPSERNQGSCGNCWVWAATGVVEIAHTINNGVKDRLSIQYLNSCKSDRYACCGGSLAEFANWYRNQGRFIPWSNTNASYADGSRRCSDGSSLVSCGSISTTPNYPITSISAETITTRGVLQATAIANIKNVLNQNKGVYFVFYLANQNDWNEFRNFWLNETESAVWGPDPYCGHTWDDKYSGGHAVLIVGYNDDDPDPANHYWLVLNSWGTAGGKRPNGLFRMRMLMKYECPIYRSDGSSFPGRWFQTLSLRVIEYYVSPAGTGTACTQTNPCSFQQALDKSKTDGENSTIYVAPGIYNITQTLTYTTADGDGSLTIQAQDPSNPPVLDGGGRVQIMRIENDSDGDRVGDNGVIAITGIVFRNGNAGDSFGGGFMWIQVRQMCVSKAAPLNGTLQMLMVAV